MSHRIKESSIFPLRLEVFADLAIGVGFHRPPAKGTLYPAFLEVIEKVGGNMQFPAEEDFT